MDMATLRAAIATDNLDNKVEPVILVKKTDAGFEWESNEVVETVASGVGALSETLAPGVPFNLHSIEVHLATAPTTGTQNLVLTKDDGNGASYDYNILTQDLVGHVDLESKPDITCKSSDAIVVSWANTDGVAYGFTFKHRLV